MIEIYVFISGVRTVNNFGVLHTACAITSEGKWLAGAVSRFNSDLALNRCREMAQKKGETMLSSPFSVSVVNVSDLRLLKALELAFERMP